MSRLLFIKSPGENRRKHNPPSTSPEPADLKPLHTLKQRNQLKRDIECEGLNRPGKLPEPGIYMGTTLVGNERRAVYLPLDTCTAYSFLVGRKGGGKSHLLGIFVQGLARNATARKINLLACKHWRAIRESRLKRGVLHKIPLPEFDGSLLEVTEGRPPVSAFVFDTHSRLVERVVEDLSREIAVIRVSEWYRRLRGRGCDPVRELSGLSSSKARARVEELAPPEENYAKAKVYWPDRAEVMEQMLVVLNLSDRRQPPGLNLLDASMWESKENCAGVLIEIFKGIWPETWGVRMEDCLRHAIYALFLLNSQRFPESQFTILDVIDFINNDHLRRELLKHPLIADANPRVASWWNDQFERMSESFRVEVTKPVLNKLNPLAGSSLLSNIFGQPRTTIDFKKLLVSGVVVLVDLAGTEIEMENAALAGAILMGVLLRQVKAVASALPEEAVPLSVLVVDEFTTIISAPYSDILSQYRKWGIRAFLATQSLVLCDRLDPVLRPLIMATADNLWILQANAEDAQFLRRELVSDHTTVAGSSAQSQAGSLVNPLAGGGGVGPDVYALVNARRGLCFLKATIKGVRRPVFSLEISSRLFQNFSKYTTSPELAALIEQEFQATRKRIVERSREIYGRSSLEASLYVNRMSEDYSCIARGYISDKENSPVINGFIDPEWQQRLSGLLVNYVEEPLREAEKRRQRAAERHFLKQQKKSQPS